MMMETVPSGTVLHGRYRIERVLGSGGFGHVYLAVDLQTNQQYAIKEYLVTGANGQAQLQHEARVLSQLHHPNLPAYQEAFIERGHYYVVISYIEGSDLTDYIRVARQRNEAIPLPQVVSWLISICEAVMFMHNQRPPVIHRDIKPDNIRIMSNGAAMLVDLGNAKATGDGARTLFFIRHQGTPGYAPPEQYPGGTGTDARSDVYALGGTLYFALTALEPPSVSTRNQALQQGRSTLPSLQEVAASNPPEESPEAQAARQFRLGVSKPAKPAPRHSRHLAQLSRLSPELLEELNRVIQRAMALKPKERYSQVIDFGNDLKRVLAAMPAPPAQATAARRAANPYTTQPHLDHAYDSIQDARNNQGQQEPPQQSSAPSPGGTFPCPQCKMILPAQSAFCPRCGYSFASQRPAQSSSNPTQHSGAYPSVQQRPGDASASAYQVQQRQQQAPQPPQGHPPQPIQLQHSGQHTALPRQSMSSQGTGQHPAHAQQIPPAPAHHASRPPYTSPTPPASHMQQQQGMHQQQFADNQHKQIKPLPGNLQNINLSIRAVMIIAAIVIVLLIIVVILVVASQGHAHAHTTTFQFLETQVLLHVHNHTHNFSYPTLGLWQRSQSLS